MPDPVSTGLAAAKTGLAAAKLVPWTQLWDWWKALFSPRVAVIGPAAGGKSTFVQVINNQGNLMPLSDHTRTGAIKKGRPTKLRLEGPLAPGELLLRSIDDTPGQKTGVADKVVDYLTSYRPDLIIVVVDASRDFDEAPARAEHDTRKWFTAIYNRAQDDQTRFRAFVKNLACVIVILNKFDDVYKILRDECHGNEDEFNRRLHQHETWYKERVYTELAEWFKLGGRALGQTDIHFFLCCLVHYKGKPVTNYDTGHLSVFATANACMVRKAWRDEH